MTTTTTEPTLPTPPATEDAPDCSDSLPRSPKDDHPFEGCGCKSCDSKSVELRCQAEGIKARAAYDESHADGPSPDKYDATRLAYAKARYTVGPKLYDLDKQLADALHEIKCRIDDKDTIECLKAAWDEVAPRLKKCRAGGCCVREHDFEPDLENCEVSHLHAQIAKYEYVTTEAEKCFTRLAAEPECLVARAANLAAEVAAIDAALHPEHATVVPPTPTTATPTAAAATATAPAAEGTAVAAEPTAPADPSTPASTVTADDTGPVDLTTLYTRALVAGWHLQQAWWGFRTIDAYVECLCRAMTVSMEGRNALAELTGELAVRSARWDNRNKCCQRLNANAVDEVLEEYIRCRHGRDPGGSGGGDDRGKNRPSENDKYRAPEREKPYEPSPTPEDEDDDEEEEESEDEQSYRSRY